MKNNIVRERSFEQDASLYIDSVGHFHIICHVYKYSEDRNTCVNSSVSAHLYSQDGHKWYLGDEQPYTTNIMLSNGTQIHLSTRFLAFRY